MVESFFSKLDARGHVKRKTRRAPYSPRESHYLFESYLSGFCPTCWAATAGAICETCGHPNDSDNLELPAARSGGAIEFVEIEVAVLELESFRDQLEAFYAEKRGQWRPHLMQFVDEMLARPLPDYPLTYVSQWGIPAPFPGIEGQVLNVWAEMLPGLMNSTREACKAAHQHVEKKLAFWHKNDDAQLVQFLGYDNAFFFAFVHLALTWGVGETIVPNAIVTNEFFELDSVKFSTSKNHLIWARELLKERDVDQVRFYLALANPEHQKMNFTRATMDMLVETKFSDPVVAALHALAGALDSFPEASERFELDALIALRLDETLARFARFYAWESFSPQRVAEHLTQLLTRIEAGAKAVAGGASQPDTFDKRPLLGRLDECRYYAMGCAGHGVPTSLSFGREVADHILGRPVSAPFWREPESPPARIARLFQGLLPLAQAGLKMRDAGDAMVETIRRSRFPMSKQAFP